MVCDDSAAAGSSDVSWVPSRHGLNVAHENAEFRGSLALPRTRPGRFYRLVVPFQAHQTSHDPGMREREFSGNRMTLAAPDHRGHRGRVVG